MLFSIITRCTKAMAAQHPPCCPAGSAPYLAANGATTGEKRTIDGAEFYISGNPTSTNKAIVMIPDIWGWNTGRIRQIADHLGQIGFVAVIPKVLQPALDGGNDDDGFPPNFDFATRGPDFKTYLQTVTWEGVLRPRLAAIFADLKRQGITHIALAGFCWGCWACAYVLADQELLSEFNIMSSVMCHPSLSIEQRVFDRDPLPVVEKILRPVLFMPAQNDQNEYRAEGAWFQSLVQRLPQCETIDFPDMTHGWVPRGDASKPEVARDVQKAVENLVAFVNKLTA